MTDKYVTRADVVQNSGGENSSRNYLVKTFRDDDLQVLQTKVNVYLLALPLAVAEDTTIHIVDIKYAVAGTQAMAVDYSVLILMYFIGSSLELIP